MLEAEELTEMIEPNHPHLAQGLGVGYGTYNGGKRIKSGLGWYVEGGATPWEEE